MNATKEEHGFLGSNMNLNSLRAKGASRVPQSAPFCAAGGCVSMSTISFATKAGSGTSNPRIIRRTSSGASCISTRAHTLRCSTRRRRTATVTIGPRSRCTPIVVNSEPSPMWGSRHSSTKGAGRPDDTSTSSCGAPQLPALIRLYRYLCDGTPCRR
jgi:hypothetical protein